MLAEGNESLGMYACSNNDWVKTKDLQDPNAKSIHHYKKNSMGVCRLKVTCKDNKELWFDTTRTQPKCAVIGNGTVTGSGTVVEGTINMGVTPVDTDGPKDPNACVASQEYECDKTIPSAYNLGASAKKATWQDCRAMCVSDSQCVGWTWSQDGTCQKKNSDTMQYQKGYRSGLRTSTSEGGGTGTTGTATTAPTTAPTTTTTAPDTETSFWDKSSPFGVQWKIAVPVLVGLLVLMLCMSCGAAMMMMT